MYMIYIYVYCLHGFSFFFFFLLCGIIAWGYPLASSLPPLFFFLIPLLSLSLLSGHRFFDVGVDVALLSSHHLMPKAPYYNL